MAPIGNYILQSLEQQEQQRLADSPTYMTGLGMQRLQPQSTRGWGWGDYIGYGAAKGLASGGLMGYGERVAQNELQPQYMDVLSGMNSRRSLDDQIDLGPLTENFSTSAARSLIADSIIDEEFKRQNREEATAAQQWLLKNNLTADIGPDGNVDWSTIQPNTALLKAELRQKLKETRAVEEVKNEERLALAEKKSKIKDKEFQRKPFYRQLPETSRKELDDRMGILANFEMAEKEMEALAGKTSTVEWYLKKHFGGTEEGAANLGLTLLAKNLTKAIEGGRPSDWDGKTYERIVKGDWTVPPEKVANLVRRAKEVLAEKAYATVAFQEKQLGGDASDILEQLNQHRRMPTAPKDEGGIPTVGGTFQGEKVLSVRKVR